MNLAAHEQLSEGLDDAAGPSWQEEEEVVESDNHHLVPARLVRVAQRLKEMDESDDATTIVSLSRMRLAQMTGQIRNVEQRALELAREEGRDEFRIKALLYNIVHGVTPSKVITARAEDPPTEGEAVGEGVAAHDEESSSDEVMMKPVASRRQVRLLRFARAVVLTAPRA